MNWHRFCYVLAQVAYRCGGYDTGRDLLRVVKPAELPVCEVSA